MFRKNWVVFMVYRDYPNREDIKAASFFYRNVTKKKAKEMAINQLCFKKDGTGVDFRSVLMMKPIKANSWSR